MSKDLLPFALQISDKMSFEINPVRDDRSRTILLINCIFYLY